MQIPNIEAKILLNAHKCKKILSALQNINWLKALILNSVFDKYMINFAKMIENINRQNSEMLQLLNLLKQSSMVFKTSSDQFQKYEKDWLNQIVAGINSGNKIILNYPQLTGRNYGENLKKNYDQLIQQIDKINRQIPLYNDLIHNLINYRSLDDVKKKIVFDIFRFPDKDKLPETL